MGKNLYDRFVEMVKRVEKELMKVNTMIDGYIFIHPSGKSKKVHIFKGGEHIAVIGGGEFEIKTKSKAHDGIVKAITDAYSQKPETPEVPDKPETPEKPEQPQKPEQPVKQQAKPRKNNRANK